MRILSITAGAAGMYCGSCLRDNALAAELLPAVERSDAAVGVTLYGAGQAMPVQVAPVTLSPVPRSDTYVATIKSRRSATMQPQVDGNLVNIFVKSGDLVRALLTRPLTITMCRCSSDAPACRRRDVRGG